MHEKLKVNGSGLESALTLPDVCDMSTCECVRETEKKIKLKL